MYIYEVASPKRQFYLKFIIISIMPNPSACIVL